MSQVTCEEVRCTLMREVHRGLLKMLTHLVGELLNDGLPEKKEQDLLQRRFEKVLNAQHGTVTILSIPDTAPVMPVMYRFMVESFNEEVSRILCKEEAQIPQNMRNRILTVSEPGIMQDNPTEQMRKFSTGKLFHTTPPSFGVDVYFPIHGTDVVVDNVYDTMLFDAMPVGDELEKRLRKTRNGYFHDVINKFAFLTPVHEMTRSLLSRFKVEMCQLLGTIRRADEVKEIVRIDTSGGFEEIARQVQRWKFPGVSVATQTDHSMQHHILVIDGAAFVTLAYN
eukprot:gene820-1839_t